MARTNPHRCAEPLHLLLGHQPGVVVLVAGERQAHALDGVGDETGRLIAIGLGTQRVDHRLDVMAAEIGHQRAELVIRHRIDDRARLGAAEIGQQRLAPRRTALEGQRRIQRVRAVIDPCTQRLAAFLRERSLQFAAVLDGDDVPAHVAEQTLDAAEQPVGHDRIETLAVVVDDPPQIADVVLPTLQQRLVDVAFVEFGIAGDGDMAARRQVGAAEAVQPHVIGHQRGECRHRNAEANRAGGKIHLRPVLRPRGIGLHAAQSPQTLHLLQGLPAEQVVDRVEHRSGMRLHRDAILRPGDFEIQRGHDGDHRGARCLMPPHLQPVAVGTDVVGLVDHPRRQPQQLAFELTQDVQSVCRYYGGNGCGRVHHPARRCTLVGSMPK